MTADYGILCLLPIAVIIVLSLATKKTFEPLLVSVVVAVLMFAGKDFLPEFILLLQKELADPTIVWVILVCGLMNALLCMLEKSRAADSFADLLGRFAKTRRRSMFATMFLGICLFIDDYLNVLTVGNTMKRVTDRHKVSRSMLSYCVGTTAAPVVVLVPISTWAVFFISLLSAEGVVGPDGTAFSAYVRCLPYMFYSIICVLVVMPLLVFGVLPLVGPMKHQEKAALERGELFPPGVEPPALVEDCETEGKKKGGIWDFVLPLVVLVTVTVLCGNDVLSGAVDALAFTVVWYLVRKLASLAELVEQFWAGFCGMVPTFGMLVLAFAFKDACGELGFVEYMIEIVTPIMTGSMLPAAVFVATALMAFAMANFWGLAAIITPIAVSLCGVMGANIYLTCAAVFCGAAFGSHACFYADEAILIGKACDIRPYDHAITQLPYVLLSAVIATVLFAVFGAAI